MYCDGSFFSYRVYGRNSVTGQRFVQDLQASFSLRSHHGESTHTPKVCLCVTEYSQRHACNTLPPLLVWQALHHQPSEISSWARSCKWHHLFQPQNLADIQRVYPAIGKRAEIVLWQVETTSEHRALKSRPAFTLYWTGTFKLNMDIC